MANKSKYITTNEALEILKDSWVSSTYKINRPLLIRWIEAYDLGFKFAGRWQVDEAKLKQFIKKGSK